MSNLLVCVDCWTGRPEARQVSRFTSGEAGIVISRVPSAFAAYKRDDSGRLEAIVCHRLEAVDDHVCLFRCGDRYVTRWVTEATHQLLKHGVLPGP